VSGQQVRTGLVTACGIPRTEIYDNIVLCLQGGSDDGEADTLVGTGDENRFEGLGHVSTPGGFDKLDFHSLFTAWWK
jgi:hypothetical protein